MYHSLKKNKKKETDMTSINSAALQDHLLKSTNLNLNFPKKSFGLPSINKKRPPLSYNKKKFQDQKLDTRNKQTFQQSAQSILMNSIMNPNQSSHNNMNYNNSQQNINIPPPRVGGRQMTSQEYEQYQIQQIINQQEEELYQQQFPQQQLQQQQQLNNENQIRSQRSNSQRQAKRSGNTKSIRVGHTKIVIQNRNSQTKKNLNKKEDPYQGINLDKYNEQRKMEEIQQEEYKMKQYYNSLTLAQKLGLVQAPQKPLTLDDWEIIEHQCEKRQDSNEQCAICLEDFKDQDQVILSCSHVFHNRCLSSFEKHNKIKSCPICRRKHYDKKSYDQGFKQYVIKCTTRIQKWHRGGSVRIKFYKSLIDSNYQAQSMLFRRRIIGYKLMKFSEKMSKALEEKQKQTDEFLRKQQQQIRENQMKIEQDLENLRKLKQKNQENIDDLIQNNPDSNIRSVNDIYEEQDVFEINQQNLGQFNDRIYRKNLEEQEKNKQKLSQPEWELVKQKAVERNEKDCAICFTSLANKKKGLYLLSCTHIFHSNCLNAFERYNLAKIHECPVCRGQYEKVHFAAKDYNLKNSEIYDEQQ